jgi:hypothetical protein
MNKQGLLIAGVGLPGVGKSSVLKALAVKHGWQWFTEPEEPLWSTAVAGQEVSGVFTALSWFRAIRVPNLYAADALRRQGEIAVLDSYYDKLMTYYLEQPQMEWLIAVDDPYYDLVKQMALIDNRCLPAADIIILLTTTFESWAKLITTRKRQLDSERVFPHAFPFQQYLLQAVTQECANNGSRLVLFENQFSTVEEAANALNERIVPLLS